MIADVIIDASACRLTLEMSEHVDGQKLFIREQRLMIVAQALLFKDGLRIVETAD